MSVTFKQEAFLNALEYAGVHSYDAVDCELDQRVRVYLIERLQKGQRRFLIDARELDFMYGSSFSGVLNSWLPAVRAGNRVAIIGRLSAPRFWAPSEVGLTRWNYFDEMMTRPGVLRFFESEEGARAFLLADRPEPGGPS